MHVDRDQARSARAGLTLVELTVVVSIMVALAALAVALLPGMNDRQRVGTGASLVQQWLLAAKQRAVRDRAPRGLRFLTADTAVATEVPADVTGTGVDVNPFSAPPVITILDPGLDLSGGVVQQNDFLKVNDGQWLRISAVGTVQPNQLTLTSATYLPPYGSHLAGSTFSIRRAARPAAGEAVRPLPQNVFIDLSQGRPAGLSFPVDVLFASSGQVLSAGPTGSFVFFIAGSDPAFGDPTLVSVRVRTGEVAACDVAPGPDPFLYTYDGRSSGH